jgi:hypothetical protein
VRCPPNGEPELIMGKSRRLLTAVTRNVGTNVRSVLRRSGEVNVTCNTGMQQVVVLDSSASTRGRYAGDHH